MVVQKLFIKEKILKKEAMDENNNRSIQKREKISKLNGNPPDWKLYILWASRYIYIYLLCFLNFPSFSSFFHFTFIILSFIYYSYSFIFFSIAHFFTHLTGSCTYGGRRGSNPRHRRWRGGSHAQGR